MLKHELILADMIIKSTSNKHALHRKRNMLHGKVQRWRGLVKEANKEIKDISERMWADENRLSTLLKKWESR